MPPNLPKTETALEPPPPSVTTEVVATSTVLSAEDLVEGVGDLLGVPGGARQMRLEDQLGIVVVEEVRPVLVALVDEQLVGLLVEHRPAVLDEVLRDVVGLRVGRVDELREDILVLRLRDHLLAVEPADKAFLREGDL